MATKTSSKTANKTARKQTRKVNQSASTGKFVKNSTVKRHPSKTVKRTVPAKPKKKSTK